jgi:TetR/AcrR family transcriptional regulator
MNRSKDDAIRDFILDKSEELIARHGYEKTSMDKIAAACDLSKPTLYNYFPGKADLFMALHMRFHRLLNERIFAAVKREKGQPAALEGILSSFFDLLQEKRGILEIISREFLFLSRDRLAEHMKWNQSNKQELVALISRDLGGVIRPELKKQFGVELAAELIFNIFEALFFDLDLVNPEQIEKHKQFFLFIFRNSILVPPAR